MAEWAGAPELRRAIGEERGSARALALKLNRDPSAVHRWLRGARPDPALWGDIERALDLKPGSLRLAEASSRTSSPSTLIDELMRRLDELERRLDEQGVELRYLKSIRTAPAQFAVAAEGATGEPRTVGRRVNRPHPPAEG